MPLFSNLNQIVRECGADVLLSNEAANVLFPSAKEARAAQLLGCRILGTPVKHDSIHIRFTKDSNVSGAAKAVDINARAYEVEKSGDGGTEVFGAIVTKETCSFDHETLTSIHAANAGCASDAQMQQIARSLMKAFDALAIRALQLKEKAFWEGTMGQMTIDVDGSTVPMTVTTNTNVLAALAGTDVWTDHVNATPLEDIATAKAAFRGSGFKGCKVAMNAQTYAEMMQSQSVKDALSGCGCGVILGNESPGKLCGMDVFVYDEGYVDSTGTFVPYIPDGWVVYVGCGINGHGAQLVECINIDDCSGQTYGSFVELLEDKNPKQKAVYHSWIGAPVFCSPEGFVAQQVY